MIKKINLKEKVDSVAGLFSYLEVGRLNEHTLNVLQAKDRTLDFHVHEKSDEMFYVNKKLDLLRDHPYML